MCAPRDHPIGTRHRSRCLAAVALALALLLGAPVARGEDPNPSGADLCYSCHVELKAKFSQPEVHAPVKLGKCELCHSPHAARFPKLLRFKGAALCYVCHGGKKAAFTASTAHSPVRQGDCLKCHDPHASPNRHLVARAGATLCLSCHGKVRAAPRTVKHMPFEAGDCLICHVAHASPGRNLLVKPPSQLCQDCHRVADARIARVHQPFDVAAVSCVGCHAPHGSDRKGLVKTVAHPPFSQARCAACHQVAGPDPTATFLTGGALCFTCHAKEAQAFKKTLVHAPVAAGQCTACHAPHASEARGLLAGEERETCLGCHGAVRERFARARSFHPAAAGEGRCTICHAPHASDRAGLLADDSLKVCTACHKQHAALSHPMGPGVTDPRMNAPMTCLACHDPHGTQFASFLTFPKERELCIQCHRGELLRTRQN